jgi:hypothetical protein
LRLAVLTLGSLLLHGEVLLLFPGSQQHVDRLHYRFIWIIFARRDNNMKIANQLPAGTVG